MVGCLVSVTVTVILMARYIYHREQTIIVVKKKKKKKNWGITLIDFCVCVIELSKEFRLNQRKHITFQCKIFSYYITWIFDQSRYKRELINGIVLLRLSFTKKIKTFALIRFSCTCLLKQLLRWHPVSQSTVRHVHAVFLKSIGQILRRLHFYIYHNIQKQIACK